MYYKVSSINTRVAIQSFSQIRVSCVWKYLAFQCVALWSMKVSPFLYFHPCQGWLLTKMYHFLEFSADQNYSRFKFSYFDYSYLSVSSNINKDRPVKWFQELECTHRRTYMYMPLPYTHFPKQTVFRITTLRLELKLDWMSIHQYFRFSRPNLENLMYKRPFVYVWWSCI